MLEVFPTEDDSADLDVLFHLCCTSAGGGACMDRSFSQSVNRSVSLSASVASRSFSRRLVMLSVGRAALLFIRPTETG